MCGIYIERKARGEDDGRRHADFRPPFRFMMCVERKCMGSSERDSVKQKMVEIEFGPLMHYYRHGCSKRTYI